MFCIKDCSRCGGDAILMHPAAYVMEPMELYCVAVMEESIAIFDVEDAIKDECIMLYL